MDFKKIVYVFLLIAIMDVVYSSEIDDTKTQLGTPALKEICDELEKENALTKVILSDFDDNWGIKKTIVINDKNDLEDIQESMLTATRKVFVFNQGDIAGEPPYYKMEVYLKNSKISIWLFSIGFSTCKYARGGNLFYCNNLLKVISTILKKYDRDNPKIKIIDTRMIKNKEK